MEYSVIVEQNNGIWRAIIPALSDLSAEGATYDEALRNARLAAQGYLSNVVVTTINVDISSPRHRRYSTVRDVLKAGGKFKGDEEAMLQHIEEIYAERRRQREEVERELDEDAG